MTVSVTNAQHDVTTLRERVRAAHEVRTPLRIVGSGTWQNGGGPFAEADALPLGDVSGVVEYVPGDLVITARAGTTLRELAEVTAAHGQMLAVAPYGTDEATLGAVVATASASPLPFADATVRDLVLGLQVITGTGECIRAGGRVVKNVAGFDLVRVHTGAFGTLGVITEVSVRLHAIPACDRIMVGPLTRDVDEVVPMLVANRAPLPLMLRLAPDHPAELWARVSGNSARAAALDARVTQFGVRAATEASLVQLRHAPTDAVILRGRMPLSDAVPFVRAARDAFPAATLLFDPASGSLHVTIPASHAGSVDRDVTTWYSLAAAGGAMHRMSVITLQGRRAATVRTDLDAGIKQAFDPRDILNRLVPTPAGTAGAYLALPDA